MKNPRNNKDQIHLEHGLSHHQSGNLRGAAIQYRNILRHHPRHPEALNLLGVVSLQTGDSAKAIKLIGEALVNDRDNPGYLNNLGQALHAAGDAAGAVNCYRQALETQPKNTDYLNNLGISLKFLGHYDAARTAFEKALLLNRRDPEIFHNFGILLQEIGDYPKAIENYRSALSLSPDLLETHGSLAAALEATGQSEEAAQSYFDAITLDPFYLEAHEGLKKIRWAAKDFDRLHESYHYACAARPDSPAAFCNLAQSLFNSGDLASAFDAVTKALELDTEHADSHNVLSLLHRAQKNYDLAIAAHQKALALDGKNYKARESYGSTLFVAGKFAESVSELLAAHRLNPRRSSILGRLTAAMNEDRDPRISDYVDYETYVTTRFVDVPDGWKDLGAFNDALHDEIFTRHDDHRPPPMDQTMRGGTQIPGHLFNAPTGLTAVVKRQISMALNDYIGSLERILDHPFLRFRNLDYRFTGAWSTILYGSGYDRSHVHNDGWLSGVYYVKVPDFPDEVWARGEGCIQFGEPSPLFVSPRNQSRKFIRPCVGMAVFFPSYYWHGVQPFEREGLRHAIAFDIV